MFQRIKIYIVFHQFKYLLNFLIILLGLIWLSQVLRLLDLKFSFSTQIIDVMMTTFFVLPSFINPLMPIILIINYIYLGFIFHSSNQSMIINQYLKNKDKMKIIIFIQTTLVLLFILNYEIVSPYLYKLYKLKEIEIRNNFKLGIPTSNQFHIGEELSIFFKNHDENNYFNVEALIYKDNQFIKSDKASIEYSKSGFNIIFKDGIRVKMNDKEKSKTIFEKFTYNVIKDNLEELLLDKDHFNTLNLLSSNQKDFRFEGHKRILQYLIFILVIAFSNKIIFKKTALKIKDYSNIIMFGLLISLYLINSYLVYELNKENINLYVYYFSSFLSIFLFIIYMLKAYDSK